MITHPSVVTNEIFCRFKNVMGKSLMNHAFNTCGIEDYLAVTSVLWPEVVEVKHYLFIAEFFSGDIEYLEKEFEHDRKRIEMFVNSWSLADFFLLASDDSVDDDEMLLEFGKILKYFWTLRFKELYRNRQVCVELGDQICGERGLTITVYQI